ncbi:hypothetical protein HY486_04515 [Candidatus Woesearchaeota archaeon]|nr:hypothetical protein [Candidatus Woesearchaeota archaeon]
MNAKFRLSWDEKKLFQEVRQVAVDVIIEHPPEGMKPVYHGHLSQTAAEYYGAQLMMRLTDDSTGPTLNLRHLNEDGIIHAVIDQYETTHAGFRQVSLPRFCEENKKLVLRMKEAVEALETHRYIEPRGQVVNDCDYWFGFFRTSHNLWAFSDYSPPTHKEMALQLAWEVENGIRTSEWGIYWTFPGVIYARDDPNCTILRKAEEINSVLARYRKLSKANVGKVVDELREIASEYET